MSNVNRKSENNNESTFNNQYTKGKRIKKKSIWGYSILKIAYN